MEFSRQEYKRELSFPSPEDLPNPRIEPSISCIAGRFLTVWATRYKLFINLELNPLSVALFANIFSHSVGCPFIFFYGFLYSAKALKSHLFIFVFLYITYRNGTKKILLWFMSKSVLHMFSPKSCKIPGLTFSPLWYFEFIFMYGLYSVLISIFYT